MAIWSRKSEADSRLDENVRTQSQTIRESRTQERNDRRRDAGLTPQHCGIDAVSIGGGDWECRRCGDIF